MKKEDIHEIKDILVSYKKGDIGLTEAFDCLNIFHISKERLRGYNLGKQLERKRILEIVEKWAKKAWSWVYQMDNVEGYFCGEEGDTLKEKIEDWKKELTKQIQEKIK